MAALIDAAVGLFAEQGPAAVSVRAVAERAGVNHGLVHRHFGSKEELQRAVFDHLAARIAGSAAERMGDGGDPATVLRSALQAVTDEPRYVRALARALLDAEPDAMQTRFPVLERLLSEVRALQRRGVLDPALDARMLVAALGALGLGWMVFEPYLLKATGQSRLSTATARVRLMETLERLARPLRRR
ncbi:MAG: TetR/AcrR family transcriptional regulator [Myxococcales bacterium]|jgi:AcrR family transcriptional regulator